MTKQSKINIEELTTLNEILNEDETNLKEFIIDMEQMRPTPESPLGSNRLKSMRLSDSSIDSGVSSMLENDFSPSTRYEEYYEVETAIDSSHKKLETFGSKNSLFLAVARSILYKIYSIDRKYKHLLKVAYSDCLATREHFKFNSDMKLQEALRRSLCTYWLSFVYNGEFTTECKYSSHFENACDFMFQAYQLSVNNFCTNRLFEQFALEDLAELMRVRIVAFNVKSSSNGDEETTSVKVYEPMSVQRNTTTLILNDSIYLKVIQSDDMNMGLYKWLMPKRLRSYIDDNILLKHDESSSSSFLRLKPAYVRYKILLPHDVLNQRFDIEFINNNVNHAIFLRFLSECSVHTLVSLDEIKFDTLLRSKESTMIIDYLNRLWGKNHFNIKEIFNQIQLNNELERIQTENKNFIQEVFKYSSIKSRELKCDDDNNEEKEKETTITATKNGSGDQLPIDYSFKNKSNCGFASSLDTTAVVNVVGGSCGGLASKRKSASECSSSDNTSSGRLSTNLYQMSSCFRDDSDDRLRRIDGIKLSKSCQEIGTESGVGESISVSPNSILESWKNLTLPLMNSLMVHRLLNNPTTVTQTTNTTTTTTTLDQESSTVNKSTNKLTGHPKRSLTWCLDSLINNHSSSTDSTGGELLKKRDAISSHDLSQ